MYIYKRVLPSYKYLNSQVRKRYTKLEADRVQNEEIGKSGCKNSKEKIDWVLIDRDQSLD